MKDRIFLMIMTAFFVVTSFCLLKKNIDDNVIVFHTDEIYWISTARIIPLLLNKRFNDPTWREYYGFTNFNGAKYIYGVGLLLFGHNEEAIKQTGVAPYTFYNWKQYDGNIFPKNHTFFQILTDARILSALFTSLSIGLMGLLGYLIFTNVWIGGLAGTLLFFHPITGYVGTHAFADSIFLFFVLLSLMCIIFFFKKQSANKYSFNVIFLNSLIFACLISTKINGLLFMLAFIWLIAWQMTTNVSRQTIRFYISSIGITLCLTSVFFLLLQPNLFFYPSYTLGQMLQDRMTITKYHVALYSVRDANRVILFLPQKMHSLIIHLFPLWMTPFFIVGALYTVLHMMKQPNKHVLLFYRYIVPMGFVVTCGIMTYVLFDEQRYFVPLLPFFILMSVSWLSVFKTSFFIRSILKSFSYMRRRKS